MVFDGPTRLVLILFYGELPMPLPGPSGLPYRHAHVAGNIREGIPSPSCQSVRSGATRGVVPRPFMARRNRSLVLGVITDLRLVQVHVLFDFQNKRLDRLSVELLFLHFGDDFVEPSYAFFFRNV